MDTTVDPLELVSGSNCVDGFSITEGPTIMVLVKEKTRGLELQVRG